MRKFDFTSPLMIDLDPARQIFVLDEVNVYVEDVNVKQQHLKYHIKEKRFRDFYVIIFYLVWSTYLW